jgi:hypothetical protein
MSPTPPLSSAPQTSSDPAANAAGDGVTLNVVEARGAQRTGAIWILVISLSVAIVALGAYWLIQAPRMGAVNHPSGQDLNSKDVRKLYTPPTTPPAAYPATNSTGGA